jgi:pimeloyl-ACP methyl ester carboxylesterase
MKFDVLGNSSAPKKGLLLHAMSLDAREFKEIAAALTDTHYLILPTFDGHHSEAYVPFTTLADQADKILGWLGERGLNDFDFVAGTSLGALAAFEIYRRGRLRVRKYVFDGGPFFEIGCTGRRLWELLACVLLGLSRLPFADRLGARWFPPEFIRICARIPLTRKDVRAISTSIFGPGPAASEPLNDGHTRLVFCYGGKEYALRSYRRFAGLDGPELLIKGKYGHCGFAAREPEAYAAMLRE